uniref:Uncharacterized protein n=1 Tax=Alloyangia mangrovi TaxID=1779329 RepID=A0A2A3JW89_9RHOB
MFSKDLSLELLCFPCRKMLKRVYEQQGVRFIFVYALKRGGSFHANLIAKAQLRSMARKEASQLDTKNEFVGLGPRRNPKPRVYGLAKKIEFEWSFIC